MPNLTLNNFDHFSIIGFLNQRSAISVENAAQELADKDNFADDEIAFMKKTFVADIFISDKNGTTFKISIEGNERFVLFSDRQGNGELRAQRLIDVLQYSPKTLTIYQAIDAALNDVLHDAYFLMLKTAFYKYDDNKKYPPATFDNFILTLNQTIPKEKKLSDEDNKVKQFIDTIFSRVYALDKSCQFQWSICLNKLENKSKDLQNRGFIKEAETAWDLKKALITAQTNYLTGKIKVSAFRQQCQEAIAIATPLLEKHRGWKPFFAFVAFVLLSIISLGCLNLVSKGVTGHFQFFKNSSTDSRQLIEKTKHIADKMEIKDNNEISFMS